MKNALLIRIGADQSVGGGRWNGPVDSRTCNFVYVPIPETKVNLNGYERYYSELEIAISSINSTLPIHLKDKIMHLDPDFDNLTYGDRGNKGQQISKYIKHDDVILFYAGLRDVISNNIVYALIGLFVVDYLRKAVDFEISDAYRNAHTRRQLEYDADDIVVVARPGISGRLDRCIPIGEYRHRAYRVREDLLATWGGVSSQGGYLQRSAVFPSLVNPNKFWSWWLKQERNLVMKNNPGLASAI